MTTKRLTWDDLSPERQDELIAAGWHPHGDGKSRRYSFNVCLECGGLTVDIDGRDPHPSWPECSCRALLQGEEPR